MKAAVFYGKHDLRVMDQPVPVPGAGQVQIRVHACGICGTDIHIFEGDEGAAKSPAGTILGHEFAGEITAVGPGVTDYQVGDRVCVDPNELCGKCDYCRGGIGHYCTAMNGYGTTVNGGFAEYCVVPTSQVYRIPDEMTFDQAAMAEPVACCIHGIDMCEIHPGDTVAIFGAGMIGLIMLQLAKLSGAATLISIEPIAEKREIARKLGADLTIDPFTENVSEVLKQHGITRVNTVIECVGRTGTIQQAIEIAGPKAVVMMFGLTKPDDEITVKPFELFKREVVLKASYINPYTQKRAVSLISSGKVDVSSMIYETIPLEQLPALLADTRKRGLGKYVVKPGV